MDKIQPPPIEELQKRISEIEKIDLNAVDIETLKELLKLLFTGYALSTPLIEKDLTLYRGIPYGQKPKTFSYLSYPPKEFARINRASREGQSFFYCSTSRQTPFFELDVQVGDKIVLSKWKTSKQLLINNIGYTDSNFNNLESNRTSPKWSENESQVSEINNAGNLLVRKFLAQTFSQRVPKDRKDLYKLTIAIAEKHYSEEIGTAVQFDGLLYPTIPMQANSDNLALTTSFIDSGGLIFKEVEFIEVTKCYDFKYDINILDWANSISGNGEIQWKGRLPQWTIPAGEEYSISIEDGKKVIRNKRGEIIEPN